MKVTALFLRLTLTVASACFIFVIVAKAIGETRPYRGILFSDWSSESGYPVQIHDPFVNYRVPLILGYWDNFGIGSSQRIIDENLQYVDICFVSDGFFCSAGFQGIVDVRDVSRFEIIDQVWSENYGSPVWSPDGSYVAFIERSSAGTNTEGSSNLYVMNTDGTNLRSLVTGDSDDHFRFTWSPDSRQLAFQCHERKQICVIGVDGSHLRTLTSNTNEEILLRYPNWSPDGNYLAFIEYEIHGTSRLQVYDLSTYAIVTIPTTVSNFQWSPTGTRLAFIGTQNTQYDIFIVSPDGSGLVNVTQTPLEDEFALSWSPDSEALAYFGGRELCGMYLYVINLRDYSKQQVADNHTMCNNHTPFPALYWLP